VQIHSSSVVTIEKYLLFTVMKVMEGSGR